MTKKTALHDRHVELGARMVDFAGWQMPVNYGSQVDEHHAVRRHAGVFDVSHMRAIDVAGRQASEALRHLLANDVGRLEDGKALYSCMLDTHGGVIDDLIVTRLTANCFRFVVNAGTADGDIEWMRAQLESFDVVITAHTDWAILAVQGPQARDAAAQILPGELRDAAMQLKRFQATTDGEWTVSRTGYTGEDGFEVLLPNALVAPTWNALLTLGVVPCGLGARDTLRLEAGMNLYGQDMTTEQTPLDCGLGWTVAWEPNARDFIGRAAIESRRASPGVVFTGVLFKGRGVMRSGYPVFSADGRDGVLTSGGFSPTLDCSIGFARLTGDEPVSGAGEVDIRGRRQPVEFVSMPFVRNGKSQL